VNLTLLVALVMALAWLTLLYVLPVHSGWIHVLYIGAVTLFARRILVGAPRFRS
jgi:heme A synthase